jgi:glycosyltransferase involved in cell wall biosynthesis
MKILFIHQNFPGQFVHLAPALARMGHEVVALSSRRPAPALPGVRVVSHFPEPLQRRPGADRSPDEPGAKLEGNLGAKVSRASSAATAMEQLRQQGFVPDVVLAHSGWGEALFVKAVFRHCRLLVYAEYFYGAPGGDSGFDPEFCHETVLSRQKTAINNLHLMQALVASDAALSPTHFQRSQHPAALQSKIAVIHDGIDTQRFKPNPTARVKLGHSGLTLTAKDEIITFVARQLEPYRGYHTFMRALPGVMARRPNARVVIVGGEGVSYGSPAPSGTSWKQVFLDEVKLRLDTRRVHFVGQVPHSTLTQLLQVSAVHVYLTYPFVLSWSLLEAMSMGCLVVASDTAPVREVIVDGVNGLLTDFFDAPMLAERIAHALGQHHALTGLRNQARATVVQKYDLATVCLPHAVAWTLGDHH